MELLQRDMVGAAGAPMGLGGVATPVPDEPVGKSIADARAAYEVHCDANKRPRTARNDKMRLGSFFEANSELQFLSEVGPADVSTFLSAGAMEGWAPATTMRYREILHAFFAYCVRMEWLERNPVSKVPKPKLPERDPRFLSRDQIGELLELLDGGVLQALVATAIYAGLRRAELCWLRWEDVEMDTERPVIRVRAKTVDGERWQPKTGRDRVVPISSSLRPYLEALPKRSAWVFPSPTGKWWDPDNLSRSLRGVLSKAGQPWSLLDMRHTFGSQLAAKGVSLLKIATLMGNSPEIARRHYIRLVPEEMGADVEF